MIICFIGQCFGFFSLINHYSTYSNLLSLDSCHLYVSVHFILSIMYDGFTTTDSAFLVIIARAFTEMVNNILVLNRVERELPIITNRAMVINLSILHIICMYCFIDRIPQEITCTCKRIALGYQRK